LINFKRLRPHRTVKTALATLAIAGLVALAAMAAVIRAGWYDVSATGQHLQVSFSIMERAMRWSVQHHARDITAPPFTETLVRRGAVVYRDQCVQCHGAPGVAPHPIGLSMQPLPGPLVHMMQRWTPAEVYWIVSNGIKMSGMPAWRYRLSAADMWAVTALVARLPALSTQDYARLQRAAQSERSAGPAGMERQIATSVRRGKLAIPQYACQSCHQIPGIVGGAVRVGPALDDYASHEYIAGYLPNTPANLARWLRATHDVKPQSAMPDLGVSPQDAGDIAAYLLAGELRE
jgi:mono/diheme cytochrome c family protein